MLQRHENAGASAPPGLQLPVPSEAEQAHSAALTALLREQIQDQGGPLSFERFMDLALYEPDLGYYRAGAARFGADGDFITAPHVSPLFSRCLARQCRQALAALGGGDILELGAGAGLMAQDLLLELEALGALPERYLILEVSADLRQRQRALLAARLPHLLPRLHWLKSLPEEPVTGIMLANELFDALPVTRVAFTDGVLYELCVGHDGDDFFWVRARCEEQRITRAWEQLAADLPTPLPDPCCTELNLRAGAMLRAMAGTLQQGVMLIIDYGYPRHEYYHPQRRAGTLLCHYRHRAHADPFFYPGLQDITASVDFSALAQAALDSGLGLAGYTSQAHFLIGCGLTELAASAQNGSDRAALAVSGQVQRLTLPGEMGERFKAIAFTRNFTQPLMGFQFIDQQQRLWRLEA